MNLNIPGQGKFQIVIDTTGINRTIYFESKLDPAHRISYQDAVGEMKYGGIQDNIELYEQALLNSEKMCAETGNEDYVKLIFLKESIFILNETKRRFIGSPYLVQDLTFLYWIIFQKTRNDVTLVEAIDVCERCLDLLADDANQDWFDRLILEKELKIKSREEAVQEIVDILLKLLEESKKTPENDAGKAAAEKAADEKKKVEQALSRAKDKLMTWYNLKKGVEIAASLQGGKIPSRLLRVISGWLPEITGAFALACIVFFRISPPFRAVFGEMRFLGFNILPVLVYGIILFSFVTALWKLTGNTKRIDFQIYLPRMAAGIIVGYLVLFSDEAWGGIFGEHGALFVLARILVPCAAVFLYILIEMNNVKGIRYSIFWKALRLFFRGAAYAFLIGLIISDLFGEAIVQRIPEAQGTVSPCLNGLVGHLYPEVVFYLAPLALFIGVFVQLLWEDKPLTAKI